MISTVVVEACNLAETLKSKLSDQMEPIAKREAYVTQKDHKENFDNNLPRHLINSARKSETGAIFEKFQNVTEDGPDEKLLRLSNYWFRLLFTQWIAYPLGIGQRNLSNWTGLNWFMGCLEEWFNY